MPLHLHAHHRGILHTDTMFVLANDATTELTSHPGHGDGLWLHTSDLHRATGWDLKPEGACFGELCVPLRSDERAQWLSGANEAPDDDDQWFDVAALADKVGQKYVHDEDVWSFGTVPAVRASTLESGFAPDFEVTDRNGATLRLSDFRGKKVLLVTWASW